MSTLKTTNLQHASAASPAIVLASDGSATAQLSSLNGGALSGARNRIINGDMRIDQRNAGASVTPTVQGYTLDRWRAALSQSSKYSVQQSSTSATGFTNSLLATSLSAYTVGSAEWFGLQQSVEGFNASDLAWGTASAKTVTLSFWVRSSLTGTFGGSLANNDASRSYPFSYTISSANTFEYKTVTIAGDTSGTWLTTNGIGIRVTFGLGVGSTFSNTASAWAGGEYYSATGATSVVGTNGATFYITGVQLEAGSVATPFERRSYGQELALCQRYAIKVGSNGGSAQKIAFGTGGNTTTALLYYYPPVTFRSTPTLSSSANVVIDDSNGAISISALSLDTGGSGPDFVQLNATATGLTQFRPYFLRGSSSTGNIVLSAEL